MCHEKWQHNGGLKRNKIWAYYKVLIFKKVVTTIYMSYVNVSNQMYNKYTKEKRERHLNTRENHQSTMEERKKKGERELQISQKAKYSDKSVPINN